MHGSYEQEIMVIMCVCVCVYARARVRACVCLCVNMHWNTVCGRTFLLCFQDEGQLLKIQKMLEEKGDSTRGIKKQLFILYCRNKDLQKVEQIKKVMCFIQPSYFRIH